MFKWFRNRSTRRSLLGELGCGLITVIVFTMPLWAFSAAARGPRYALTVLVGLIVVLAVVAVLGRLFRR